MRWNKIGADGATSLSHALADESYTQSLEKLYLDGNKLGDEGVMRLAEAIKINKESKIKVLHLAKNKIGDGGAKSLAKMIEKNTTLKEISLNNNRISDRGLKCLFEALQKNTSIEKVDLRNNFVHRKRDAKSLMERRTLMEQLNFSSEKNSTTVENTSDSSLQILQRGFIKKDNII